MISECRAWPSLGADWKACPSRNCQCSSSGTKAGTSKVRECFLFVIENLAVSSEKRKQQVQLIAFTAWTSKYAGTTSTVQKSIQKNRGLETSSLDRYQKTLKRKSHLILTFHQPRGKCCPKNFSFAPLLRHCFISSGKLRTLFIKRDEKPLRSGLCNVLLNENWDIIFETKKEISGCTDILIVNNMLLERLFFSALEVINGKKREILDITFFNLGCDLLQLRYVGHSDNRWRARKCHIIRAKAGLLTNPHGGEVIFHYWRYSYLKELSMSDERYYFENFWIKRIEGSRSLLCSEMAMLAVDAFLGIVPPTQSEFGTEVSFFDKRNVFPTQLSGYYTTVGACFRVDVRDRTGGHWKIPYQDTLASLFRMTKMNSLVSSNCFRSWGLLESWAYVL